MKIKMFSLLLLLTAKTFAQSDPEFPKGFIMHLKLTNGMVTRFDSYPDLYTGGLHLLPQFTIVEHKLRGGANIGAFYTNKKIQAAAGPMLSFKLKTLNAKVFGSAGNINVVAEHLWGSDKQRLIGVGLNIDVLNKIVIGLMAHRDYNLNTWWFQNGVAIRISKKKKVEEPFN